MFVTQKYVIERFNCTYNYLIHVNSVNNEYFQESTKINSHKNEEKSNDTGLLYGISDKPVWYLCLLLGFQVIINY